MKLKLRISILSFIIGHISLAQLVVSNSAPYNSPQYLVEQVLINGNGAVSNVQYFGANQAMGHFNSVNTNLGMSSGILLTTGSIQNAVGPNIIAGVGTNNGQPGDSLLTALTGVPTFDRCVLQFDFVAATDSLNFRYIFGSEEYPEFVGSSINEGMGIFITGPNPAGGSYQNDNLAVIPGTTTPVSINTLNCQNFSTHYVCNDPSNNPVTQCSPSYACPTSASQTKIQYDGFTVPLSAQAALVCGQTYTIRIGIADGGDQILDSGLFLEAGAFSSFSLNMPSSVCANSPAFPLSGSTPAGGAYYVNGVLSTSFDPAALGVGTHTIVYVFSSPGCSIDSISSPITVHPAVYFSMNPISSLCLSSGNYILTISPTGGMWTGTGVIMATAFNPTIAGLGSHTLTYTYTSSPGCTVDTTIVISVFENPSKPIIVQVGNALTCNLNGMSYQWLDAQGNPISGANSQIFFPPWGGTYSVLVTNANGCSNLSDPFTSVGIEEAELGFAWEIFPNPSSGEFMVRFETQGSISGELTVEDAAGRIVYRETLSNHSGIFEKRIALENAQSAVYNVSIHANGSSVTRRLVIQK